VRTPPETRETATITVTESGYLDDAIGANGGVIADKEGGWFLEKSTGALGAAVQPTGTGFIQLKNVLDLRRGQTRDRRESTEIALPTTGQREYHRKQILVTRKGYPGR